MLILQMLIVKLIALLSTVGQSKVELMKERIADINPDCEVIALKMFYTEETYEEFFELGSRLCH